jgi:hypothetical protein
VHLPKILLTGMVQNWYLFFLFIGLVAALYFTYGNYKRSKFEKSPCLFYPVSLVFMALTMLLTVGGMRGALI